MNQFVEYIENTLHINVNVAVYSHENSLPLYLRNGYELCLVVISGIKCLFAQPKESQNLTVLRKQITQLKKITSFDCVLCLDNARVYTKEKMLAEGIPFIIAGQQIYLPFVGVALSKKGMRDIPEKDEISFITQKLLLTAVYKGWKNITLTEAAKFLDVSKMSVTRCFDEIQALGLPLIMTERKMRRFQWDGKRLELWNTIQPVLRNPVIRQYRLAEGIHLANAKLGGMSAVCHYSMLDDNSYKTYAINKEAEKQINTKKLKFVPDNENASMVVQVMGYGIAYNDSIAIDPLTAVLTLTDIEKSDPRVETETDNILEEFLHD